MRKALLAICVGALLGLVLHHLVPSQTNTIPARLERIEAKVDSLLARP